MFGNGLTISARRDTDWNTLNRCCFDVNAVVPDTRSYDDLQIRSAGKIVRCQWLSSRDDGARRGQDRTAVYLRIGSKVRLVARRQSGTTQQCVYLVARFEERGSDYDIVGRGVFAHQIPPWYSEAVNAPP